VPIIQNPEAAEKLRVRYKLREPYAPTLAEEVVPVTVVDDLSGPSENRGYPRGAIGFASPAAGGAGTKAQVIFVPRINQGLVYRLDAILIRAVVDGLYRVRVGLDAVGLSTSTVSLSYADLRLGGSPDGFVGASTPLTAAVVGTALYPIAMLADTIIRLPVKFLLGSGNPAGVPFVNVVNDTENQASAVAFEWTEFLTEDR